MKQIERKQYRNWNPSINTILGFFKKKEGSNNKVKRRSGKKEEKKLTNLRIRVDQPWWRQAKTREEKRRRSLLCRGKNPQRETKLEEERQGNLTGWATPSFLFISRLASFLVLKENTFLFVYFLYGIGIQLHIYIPSPISTTMDIFLFFLLPILLILILL